MRTLIFIGTGLLIFAWFVMGEKSSAGQKAATIIFIVGLYVGIRLLGGATLEQILAPLFSKPENY